MDIAFQTLNDKEAESHCVMIQQLQIAGFRDAAVPLALSGLSPKPGSQKTLKADRKGKSERQPGIKLPTRDPKKILVGHVIRLHGPQKPWPDKNILCFCTVSSRVAAHPGLASRQRGDAVLELKAPAGYTLPPPAGGCLSKQPGPHHTHTHREATQGLRRDLQGEGSAVGLC